MEIGLPYLVRPHRADQSQHPVELPGDPAHSINRKNNPQIEINPLLRLRESPVVAFRDRAR